MRVSGAEPGLKGMGSAPSDGADQWIGSAGALSGESLSGLFFWARRRVAGLAHRVAHRFTHKFVALPTVLTRHRGRIGYGCFVLRESKDKLSMVPRQGQTCRGYPFLGPENFEVD